MLKIAFSGKAGSGKDTACDYIVDVLKQDKNMGSYKLKFAKPVYNLADYIQGFILGVPIHKDRLLLQTIGTSMKDVYGEDVWVNIMRKSINGIMKSNKEIEDNTYYNIKPFSILISDLRFKNEADMLRENGFILVRLNRVMHKDDLSNVATTSTHISETSLDDYDKFDYIIDNNGQLNDLYAQLHYIMKEALIPK